MVDLYCQLDHEKISGLVCEGVSSFRLIRWGNPRQKQVAVYHDLELRLNGKDTAT